MNDITYADSLKALLQVTQELHAKTETVAARDALFRVLAAPVYAGFANPAAPVAAMDGIAVQCTTIPDALVRLKQGQWISINTGEVIPEPFDCVIKIEEVQWEENIPVLTKKPNIFQNVRMPGEDFDKGTLLLASEHHLFPQDLSLLLASGCETVEIFKKPRVTFIPTGSELIEGIQSWKPGKILETNSAMVAGFVEQWGGIFRTTDFVPDDPDDLAQTIKVSMKDSDVIVISAGTSKGTKDLTANVLGLMGKLHFHGVQISPGKPVLLGTVSGIPVLGLPGYPGAAYVCSYLYLRPLVSALSHIPFALPRSIYTSAEEIHPRSQDAFYRVVGYEVDGVAYVRRIEGGSGSIASLSRMDGMMHIPPGTTIKKRDAVRVDVIHDRASKTVAARGIMDPGIIQLFSLLRKSLPDWRLQFWESPAEEALQSIVERNSHIAVLNVPTEGHDDVDDFVKRLQEQMHRVRALTRTSAIQLKERSEQKNLRDLPADMKIAVPKWKLHAWKSLLERQNMAPNHFQVIDPGINERQMVNALASTKWDAILIDSRLIQDASTIFMTVREHIDFVIPDGYMDLAVNRKLVDLILSDEFWMWVETQHGCDVKQRGLIE